MKIDKYIEGNHDFHKWIADSANKINKFIHFKNIRLSKESKFLFEKCCFENVDFSECTNFFQKLPSKSLGKSVFKNINLANVNLNNIKIQGCYFDKNTIFPNDYDFFQKIYSKKAQLCVFEKIDFNKFNFDGVNLTGCVIKKNCILPNDKMFFQKIYKKSIAFSILEEINLSQFEWEDIEISGAKFGERCSAPTDTMFFQKIKNKSLIGTSFPSGDYSMFSFEGVAISDCKFGKGTIFPMDKKLLHKVKFLNIKDIDIQLLRKIGLYDISIKKMLPIDLTILDGHIYRNEYDLLCFKFQELIENGKLKLPTKIIDTLDIKSVDDKI